MLLPIVSAAFAHKTQSDHVRDIRNQVHNFPIRAFGHQWASGEDLRRAGQPIPFSCAESSFYGAQVIEGTSALELSGRSPRIIHHPTERTRLERDLVGPVPVRQRPPGIIGVVPGVFRDLSACLHPGLDSRCHVSSAEFPRDAQMIKPAD